MEDQEATHWEAITPSRWARAREAVSKWLQGWPLFAAILFWVVLGLTALTTLTAIWAPTTHSGLERFWSVWSPGAAGDSPYEILKLALTVIGGAGAVGYLVIKFRERTAAEREEQRANRRELRELTDRKRDREVEIENKLITAVHQLGSSSPQVRIAGVYALEEIADSFDTTYTQRVVNILCGYLRSERNTLPNRRLTTEPDNNQQTRRQTCTNMFGDGPADRSVESTILEVIKQHLLYGANDLFCELRTPKRSWAHCNFDFHHTTFVESVDFSYCKFDGEVDFSSCHFLDDSNFRGTTFSKRALFRECTFYHTAQFEQASFKLDTDIQSAVFTRFANFRRALFRAGVTFRGCTFAGEASFEECVFSHAAGFGRTLFIGAASFEESTFSASADFRSSMFARDAYFSESRFEEEVQFGRSSFGGEADFWKVSFGRGSGFWCTEFHGDATFGGCTFEGDIFFGGCSFLGETVFGGSTFANSPVFLGAAFNQEVHARLAPITGASPFHPVEVCELGLPHGARWISVGTESYGCNDVRETPPTD